MAALFWIGCAQDDVNPAALEVELNIYSGRVNPRWELDAADAQHLRGLLTDLEASAPPPEAPGLGYRGVAITSAHSDEGFPERVEVYRGVLTLRRGAAAEHYRDKGDIEGWLLGQARQLGYPAPPTESPD